MAARLARSWLAVSAADTRVPVSGSGRLQSADAALCLTGLGHVPVSVLERKQYWPRNSSGNVEVSLRHPTNTLLKVVAKLWPRLWKLIIAGEQRQHS